MEEKYCKFCGQKIPLDAVVCTHCGRQVEELKGSSPEHIVINNVVNASATATASISGQRGNEKNKWISLFLCIFTICGHKFYEGKIVIGVIYFFTGGLLFIGCIIDIIVLLGKPNPYYV